MVSRTRLTLAAFLSQMSFAASINMLFAAMVRMGDELGVRPEMLASITSIYFAGYFVVSMLSGYLSDRYDAKKVLLAGCVLTVLGGLSFAFTSGWTLLLAGVLAMGLGGGVLEGMSAALLTRLYPERERLAVNLAQAGYCFGAIAGPLLMGIFMPRGVNWRVFFLLVAVLGSVNFWLFVASRFAARRKEDRISLEATAATLSQWSVIQLCLVIFLYVLAETALVGFLNVYLFQFNAAPEGIAIQSIALFWGVMLLGRVLCSLLPGRIADRKIVSSTMVLGAAAVAASSQAGDWRSALACFLGAGFFMAGAWPTVVALTAARHRAVSSTVVGVTVAVGSLGCVIAPPIMGLLFQVADPSLVMALPAIPLLLGGLLALQVPRRAGQNAPSSLPGRL